MHKIRLPGGVDGAYAREIAIWREAVRICRVCGGRLPPLRRQRWGVSLLQRQSGAVGEAGMWETTSSVACGDTFPRGEGFWRWITLNDAAVRIHNAHGGVDAAATEAAIGYSTSTAICRHGGSGYAGDDLIRRLRRHLLACGFGPGSALKAHRAFIHYRTALCAPEGKAFGGDYALRCADSYTQGLWRQIAAATEAAIVFTAVASFLCFTSSRPRRRAVSYSIPISLSTSSSVVAQLVAMRLITRPSSSFSQKSSSAPSDRRASVSSSSTTKIWFVGVSMAKR